MRPPFFCRWLRVLEVVTLLVLTVAAGERVRAVDASSLSAIVMVESDAGRGTGFFLKMGDRTYVVTSSRAVLGSRNIKFKNLSNAELTTGPLEIADHVDALRAAAPGAKDALELEPQIGGVKIGDAVVVLGDAQGTGVIGEIPGTITGIGPDRIEVDAPFAAGNSGSPILLKSSGKVIGLAAYVEVPTTVPDAKSPFSLNQGHRFGYRLDTVANWIAPPARERLVLEGMKLVELEQLIGAITKVLEANATSLAKSGANGFVTSDQAHRFPAFAALSMAIDDFARQHAAANADTSLRATAEFFAKLKSIVINDTRGLAENSFTGYYALQLKDTLGRIKQFTDWSESAAMAPFRESWLSTGAVTVNGSADKPPETKKSAAADRHGEVDVDSRDFSISGSGFTMAVLQEGNNAFSNRTYVWEAIPASLRGRRYTQTAGGETAHLTVHAKRDVVLEVITASDQHGPNLTGWQAPGTAFAYSDGKGARGKGSRMVLYHKSLQAGQDIQIPQGNWSGVLVLVPD